MSTMQPGRARLPEQTCHAGGMACAGQRTAEGVCVLSAPLPCMQATMGAAHVDMDPCAWVARWDEGAFPLMTAQGCPFVHSLKVAQLLHTRT